jgi:AAA ATPase domain
MFLKRVQVADFRALKNVDISFEPHFRPKVFPLGSQNGGGKSTLLQLIFVLLHCSGDSEKFDLLENVLQGYEVTEKDGIRELANIQLLDDAFGDVALDFFCCANEFLASSFRNSDIYKEFLASSHEEECHLLDGKADNAFETIREIPELKSSILKTSNKISKKKSSDSQIISVFYSGSTEKSASREVEDDVDISSLKRILLEAQQRLHYAEIVSEGIRKSLYKQNIVLLCSYEYILERGVDGAFLACRISASKMSNLNHILKKISIHTFLAAPSTQVFLFLPIASRRKLFSNTQSLGQGSYSADLKMVEKNISNFFAYDFLLVEKLVNLFEDARNKDFKAVVETGAYGDSYHRLLDKMNSVLVRKKINSRSDLSGIRFYIEGSNIELQPEDLSHGELKRFSIYMWLTNQLLENSIVLMDEIEIALHPDWQYHIVGDLLEWGPTNQYILSTHSYELCRALPPAHVKEIEPNLLPQPQSV